mmetsp:Transcript_6808/g.8991  ORF Transcript_6808/g.8991 Transcript_6808/m.8991 type:complete len:426 (-) Transcript_6808:185-1462(-)
MGNRCLFMHDPSAEDHGPSIPWLKKEMIGNEIGKDAYSNNMTQMINSGNPFGRSCIKFEEVAGFQVADVNKKGSTTRIKEEVVLQIVLDMRGDAPGCYCKKYQPSHVVEYNSRLGMKRMVCMMCKEAFFQVVNLSAGGTTTTQGSVIRITREQYDKSNKTHIRAQMIAFGTISDPKVPGCTVCINPSQDCIKELTTEKDIKLSIKNNEREDLRSVKETTNAVKDELAKCSGALFMLRTTTDMDAFNFQTNVMHLQLQSFHVKTPKDAEDYKKTKEFLEVKFRGLEKHWTAWSWPVSADRVAVDETTLVPPVNAKYYHPAEKGQMTEQIWKSFVSIRKDSISPNVPAIKKYLPQSQEKENVPLNNSRLPIFEDLEMGKEYMPQSVEMEVLKTCPLDNALLVGFEELHMQELHRQEFHRKSHSRRFC